MRQQKKKASQKKATTQATNPDVPIEETKLSFWQKFIPISILSFLTMLIYWPSLTYPFQFDDLANISKKFTIRFDNPLARWWTHSRWFSDWLNTLNYKIGRFDPFSYRLFNVLIHLFSGIILFLLVLQLCRFLTKKPFFYNHALLIASTTSALFLLHPVQTQTVSYVIQARIEGLASLFILATLYSFVRVVIAKTIFSKTLSIASLFIIGMLSCGTKEIVVVTPFLLLLIDWFFIAQEDWANLKQRSWLYGIFGVFFIGWVLHYVGSHVAIDALSLKRSTANNRGNILTKQAFDVITPFHYLISEFRVILHYLIMFVWPFVARVEYDWTLVSSFFDPLSFFPFLLLLGLFSFALYSAIKRNNSFVSFGLFWFFVCVAPRSTIIPSPELVCDYKTYLASVGILFIVSIGIIKLLLKLYETLKEKDMLVAFTRYKYAHKENLVLSMMLISMIPVLTWAYVHNKQWESAETFWEYNVKRAPLKARAHNNYGVALSEAGKFHEAIKEYNRAIELDKHYQDPLSNVAVAHSMVGNLDKAIESLKLAIHLSPDYAEAYNNLGSLYLQKKMYKEAENVLDFAIKIRPYYGKAFYNKARMYEAKKEPEKIWANLKKAVEGDLDLPEVFYKLGQISLQLKKYKYAASVLETAIKRGLNDKQVWFNLGNAYFMTENYKKSQSIYEQLVRQEPTDARFAYNLAETLFTKKEYDKALALFRKTTQLPNPLPQAFFRVARCLEQMKKVPEARGYLNNLLALKNVPDSFKKVVKNEISRLEIQEKLDDRGGKSIRFKDLQSALAKRDSEKPKA